MGFLSRLFGQQPPPPPPPDEEERLESLEEGVEEIRRHIRWNTRNLRPLIKRVDTIEARVSLELFMVLLAFLGVAVMIYWESRRYEDLDNRLRSVEVGINDLNTHVSVIGSRVPSVDEIASIVEAGNETLIARIPTLLPPGPGQNGTQNDARFPQGSAAGRTIAIATPDLIPFFAAMRDGAIEQAEEYNWTVVNASFGDGTNASEQFAILEQTVSQGVDAIALANFFDDAELASAIFMANSASIPVFVLNRVTPVEVEGVVEYIGYDPVGGFLDLGHFGCDSMTRAGQGKVFILGGPLGSLTELTSAFHAGLQENCSEAEVIEDYSDFSAAPQATEAALAEYPDIKLIFSIAGGMTADAVSVVNNAGFSSQISIIGQGIDDSSEVETLIRQGDVAASLGFSPREIGRTAVEQMNRYFMGESIPQILITPTTIVTEANLDAYLAGETWTQPIAGEA